MLHAFSPLLVARWNSANEFRKMFPQVELVGGSIITEEHGIYSSGDANSYWKMLLNRVEKYTCRDTAPRWLPSKTAGPKTYQQ